VRARVCMYDEWFKLRISYFCCPFVQHTRRKEAVWCLFSVLSFLFGFYTCEIAQWISTGYGMGGRSSTYGTHWKFSTRHQYTTSSVVIVSVVPLHAVTARRGSKGVAPLVLNLGIRWRRVINLTSHPLYHHHRPPPRGKNPGANWIGGWTDSQSRSGHCVTAAAIRTLDRPACSVLPYQHVSQGCRSSLPGEAPEPACNFSHTSWSQAVNAWDFTTSSSILLPDMVS
jgi:hypothetical protein